MTDYAEFSREDLIERIQTLEHRLSGEGQSVEPHSASEVKYQALFDNMVEEVHFWKVVRDETGAIITWRLVDINPAAERSWGMNRKDIIGKSADEIFFTAKKSFHANCQKNI